MQAIIIIIALLHMTLAGAMAVHCVHEKTDSETSVAYPITELISEKVRHFNLELKSNLCNANYFRFIKHLLNTEFGVCLSSLLLQLS